MATHRFLLAPCLRPQAPCARPLRFPGQAPRARSAPRGRGAAAALALGLVLAWPGGGAAASPHAADAAALRGLLNDAEKSLDKAADALQGHDPGRVSLILQRADQEVQRLQEASGLEELHKALESGRGAARAGDLAGAMASIRTARDRVRPLSDFVVVRQSEESSRAALSAAQAGDATACAAALDRFAASILAPVLSARLREARQAIGRARTAMVRNDMAMGRTEVGAARRALDGLRYAGALSRALFALQIGSEMLREGATLAARSQVQQAVRDLRIAVDTAPEPKRGALQEAHGEVAEMWKRMNRPRDADAARLLDLSRTIETIRMEQA